MSTPSKKQTDSEFFQSIGIDLVESKKDIKSSDSEFSKTAALLTVTGTSFVLGFFGTLAMAKKRDGASLDKALLQRRGMTESGTKLALRALGYGTLYAIAGFSLVSLTLYQMFTYRDRIIRKRQLIQEDIKNSEFDKNEN